MSFLHEQGDLSRTPLAAILLEALNLHVTGVLTVQHGDGTSRLFIRAGKPVGAQVVTGIRPLGHMLLQAGVIDIDALSQSLARMAETRRPQGELLVEMGAVSRERVDQALAEQQSTYFGLIAALDQGAFRFDASEPVPAWVREDLLSPLRTIVDALERPQAGALVISALQTVAAGAIRLSSGYRSVAGAFRWSAAEQALVSRLEGPATLEACFAPSGVAPERARAVVAALLLLGLALSAADGGRPTGESGIGLELEVEVPQRQPQAPPPVAAAAAPTPPPAPARRSDPAEARARRQRLLQQAMRNMGIGPFSGPARPTPSPHPGGPGPARPAGPVTQGSTEAALRKALLAIAPRAREKDLFARLGLTPGAGREEVKQAFLSLARQFHPDRFVAPALCDMSEVVKEFFTAVNEAYETLSDDRRRNAYMAQRSEPGVAQAEAARMDFVKGEACLRTRDFARARGFYEAAVRADPRAEYKAALALAIVSDPGCKERDRARSLSDEAVKDPACGRAAFVAGLLARDDRDDARAEKHFRAALAIDPRNADAVRELRMIERKRAH
jgi:tetratricopeptide (TPR) repeat protein